MFNLKIIILFLIILLLVKFYYHQTDKFTQGPGPSPGPSSTGPSPTGPSPTGPSPTGPSPTGPSPTGPSPTGPSPTGPSPRPSLTGPSPTGPTDSGTSITGIEILFKCGDCSVDSFSEDQKRTIINHILDKFKDLDIENVEFKNGSLKILLFLNLDDIDNKYINDMLNTIKNEKMIIEVGDFKLESFDVRIIYETDEYFINNKKFGCNNGGGNDRNNLKALKIILDSSKDGNMIVQFKPCGPANIFAPYIEINGKNRK